MEPTNGLGRVWRSSLSQPLPAPLGTLAAIHPATAILWRERDATNLVMATHDAALGVAARASGLRVVGTWGRCPPRVYPFHSLAQLLGLQAQLAQPRGMSSLTTWISSPATSCTPGSPESNTQGRGYRSDARAWQLRRLPKKSVKSNQLLDRQRFIHDVDRAEHGLRQVAAARSVQRDTFDDQTDLACNPFFEVDRVAEAMSVGRRAGDTTVVPVGVLDIVAVRPNSLARRTNQQIGDDADELCSQRLPSLDESCARRAFSTRPPDIAR